MPAPANADELLDLIQKSGVVDEPKLRNSVQKLSETAGVPKDPALLASHLVRDAVLTMFQAEQLLQGKYKRFSIGKYKVLERLGAGGMAQVFLCEHKLMRRRVAIKVLPTAKADDPSSLSRFYREARAVAAVDHPNIVRAYDIDQDENLHFLVMEYVDGTNLQDLVKKFGPLDITRACHYIYGSAVGLQHANEMGLIHRDIKPGNILIDRSGVVKILDMGLAKFFHADDDAITRQYDENVLGTADYLAPEQALDSATVDIRADIYSLGATFYFLLTASALFPEGSVAQKLIWHQNRSPRPIRSLRPDVPPEIAAIVERMMAKDPAQRFQSPGELLVALGPWVATPIAPPSEKELPQVSPAAGGVGFRSPSSSSAATATLRNTHSGAPDAPTIIASVPATPTKALPTVHATPTHPIPALNYHAAPLLGNAVAPPIGASAAPNAAVWETLASDPRTPPDTPTRDIAPKQAASKKKPPPARAKSRSPFFLAALAVVAVLCAATAIYIAFGRKPPQPEVQATGPHKITVTSTPGEFCVPTLRAALTRVAPGETIVIAEARLIEPGLKLDKIRHRDITIESANPDRPAVVEAKDNSGVMFDASGIEGFHLKNVEFDGKDSVNVGIQISGVCPGLVLENVTVRNVKVAGLQLLNSRGEAGKPIQVDHLRVASIPRDGSGIWLHAAASIDNRWIAIQNSRFEGRNAKEGTGIRAEDVALDVEIAGSRFFNLNAAISFARPPKDKTVRLKVLRNTIVQTNAGLLFDQTQPPPIPNEPPQPAGKLEVAIAQNYFASTPEIGKVMGANGPLPGVIGTDNACGPDAGGGNLGLALIPLAPAPQLISLNPNDDDVRFLRFANGVPELGPTRAKVGAP